MTSHNLKICYMGMNSFNYLSSEERRLGNMKEPYRRLYIQNMGSKNGNYESKINLMEGHNIMKFKANFNNKLDCTYFTTIRPHSDSKYLLRETFNIMVDGKNKGIGTIIEKKTLLFKEIPNSTFLLDCGCENEEATILFQKFYGKEIKNRAFDIILLKKYEL